MNPIAFRLTLFILVLLVMSVAETVRPVRSWETMRWKRWSVHMAISVVNTVLTRLVVAAPLFMWVALVQEKQWGLAHLIGIQGVLEILATVIVFDGLDYWWHRLNHRISFLWRFHRYHHMDTHVDVTTALRFHPGELFLSYFAKSTWILLWGPSLTAFILFEALITAYSMFHHSNMDFPDRVEAKLRWIHMTPRLHASHHTVTQRTRDANYSTIFLIWDRIFGTFREPDREEMKTLGLPTGRLSYLSLAAYLKTPFTAKLK